MANTKIKKGDKVRVLSGKEAGKTGAAGEFAYDYQDLPAGGIELAVTKPGYKTWTRKGPIDPGQQIEAELAKRVVVTVAALTLYDMMKAVDKGMVIEDVRVTRKEKL